MMEVMIHLCLVCEGFNCSYPSDPSLVSLSLSPFLSVPVTTSQNMYFAELMLPLAKGWPSTREEGDIEK